MAPLSGGLVGEFVGSISNSHATGTVSGGASSDVGGLVGLETFPDPISNSYATGAVSGGPNSFVGGLVGEQDAGTTISNSYATGAVNGGQFSDVGGLVGELFGECNKRLCDRRRERRGQQQHRRPCRIEFRRLRCERLLGHANHGPDEQLGRRHRLDDSAIARRVARWICGPLGYRRLDSIRFSRLSSPAAFRPSRGSRTKMRE